MFNEPPRSRLRYGGGAAGIERLDAFLVGEAFSPHRHDSYAIGVTRVGVQTFRYRGEKRFCLPREGHILHPDETHDGAPGTDLGFGYTIIYIDPALVQEALGGAALPFVADPIVRQDRLDPTLISYLTEIGNPLDELERLDVTLRIATLLERQSSARSARKMPLALDALTRVRDLLIDDPAIQHTVAELEAVSGVDRWSLARQFREAFGTSPTRFRTLRQLDRARSMLKTGGALADVAVSTGFADQSHFTRMFKSAYGITPGRWAKALA